MKRKRSFASPIRFFGSDEVDGLKKAILLALDVFTKCADKQVGLNIFCGRDISIFNDGKSFDVDFDDIIEMWGYNRILNHPLNISDTENFGLVNEEKLTLLQLVCEYMDIKTFDGEFEYWVRFQNGVVVEPEPKAYYREREKNGNQLHFKFDSSLFLASVNQIETDFFKNAAKELAKQNKGKEFLFCYQPDPSYAETYTFISVDGVHVKTKQEKIKSII